MSASGASRGSLLVTGAGGFIGRHTVRQFADRGWRVSGLGHGSWPGADRAEGGLAAWRQGDVDPTNLTQLAVEAGGFDSIIHLAGGSSVATSIAAPLEDFRRSVLSTAMLLEWLRLESPQTRVLVVSSAAVYGAKAPAPVSESYPPDPISPYGVHKRMVEMEAEQFARMHGLSVAIARLFSVYGPGLKKQLLWDLCSRLARGSGPLIVDGTGEEQRDWLHVDDAVTLFSRLLSVASPEAPLVNGGTGIATRVADVAAMIAEALSGGRPIQFTGRSRAGDPFVMRADTRRAEALGHRVTIPLPEGIARYVAWYRHHQITP